MYIFIHSNSSTDFQISRATTCSDLLWCFFCVILDSPWSVYALAAWKRAAWTSFRNALDQHEGKWKIFWLNFSLIFIAFLLSYFSHSVILVQLRKAVKAQICCVVCGFSLWRCLLRSVPDWSLFEVTNKKQRHFHLWLILFSHLSHAFLSHVSPWVTPLLF